jgi:hypothetical protein
MACVMVAFVCGAQAVRPQTFLPWPLFAARWGLAAATNAWLLRPLVRRWLLFAFCLPVVISGDLWWLFALVLVFGFRWPVLWTAPLTTKITPAVGAVWLAVRRERAKVGVAAATALAAMGHSVEIFPAVWGARVRFLRGRPMDGLFDPMRSMRGPRPTV